QGRLIRLTTSSVSYSFLQYGFDRLHDILDRKAEVLEQYATRSGFAKGVDTDHGAVQANILAPEVGDAGFDRNTLHARDQHAVLVGLVLTIEHIGRRHGNHARLGTGGIELGGSLDRQIELGAGRDQDDVRRAADAREYITALADQVELLLVMLDARHVLTAQHQAGRAILALDGRSPGHGGFGRAARTPYVHARNVAQTGGSFDRLVGRAVFALTDGVVGQHVDHAQLHQRRHPHAVAHVVGELVEGTTERQDAAVQCHAVHDRGHAELAHAVGNIVAWLLAADVLEARIAGQVGTGQVGRTADELGQYRCESGNGVLRCLAGGHAFGLVVGGLDEGVHGFLPVGWQVTGHAALEFRSFGRIGLGIGVELGVPLGFGLGAALDGVPAFVDLLRHDEGLVRPADVVARGSDFFQAQRGTVAVVRTALVRRTRADDGLAAEQGGLVGDLLGFLDRLLEGVDVVTVDRDHVPAVGLETTGGVVGVPAFDMAVDGNAVVIPERDQLAQAPGTGQCAGFVGHAFHHAAVAEETVGVVIDDIVAGLVELVGQQLLRHGEA